MARIPLAEIPNAPMGGKPALANPQFPRDEVGGQAISQIRQGYESNMVNARAASAMGTAMQNVGTDIINTADNIGDGVSAYSRMANAEATAQFLNNLTDVQGGMKQQMAGADPSMYPVIVKNTYQTKDGQLNPALFQGISPFGRRFVEADAQRAVAKDMAEYSLAAHIANLDQDEGRKLASMQTLINGGQYDDAATMNESLFTTRRLSPEAYASNKIAIEGARDTKNLMAAIQANPVVMGEKLQKAIMSGTPIPDIKNISLESYPRYLKAAEYAHTFQTTEKVTAMVDLVDSNTMTLESLRANPTFKSLGQKERTALERRVTNNKAGSTQSEMLIREGMNKLAAFPSTDAPAREMLEMVTWATANIPDPHLEPILNGLQKRVAEMAENGGSLKPNSDIERYVANKLNLQASMGLFGQVPAKQSGEEQSPQYVQQQLVIETAKMDALEKFRKAGITNQRDADEFLNQLLLPAQAKAALKAEPGVFQRAWRSMFPAEPPAKPTDPLPTRTPMPTRQDTSATEPAAINPKGTAKTLKVDPNVNPNVYKTWDTLIAKHPDIANWGIWGDEAHKKRKSDHNTGDAIDIGVPNTARGSEIANDLVAMAGDANIKYLIHNKRIWKPDTGWQPYKGSHDHSGHIHVSYNKPATGNLVASL